MQSSLKFIAAIIAIILVSSCDSEKSDLDKEDVKHPETSKETSSRNVLPYHGYHEIEDGDTIYHYIPPFGGLINQHGDTIDYHLVDNSIYVADFFFTSCGGQCPKMTAALKRVQQNCKDLNFLILSYTVDPRRDSAETFQRYIKRSGIDDYNWHFLTGKKEYLRELGETGYIAVSGFNYDDASLEQDNHSSYIFLIDKERHIRGYYNGTDPKEVDQLMADLRLLSESYE